MIALHGTDPVTVYLSAWARTGCSADDVDEAIYNERALVRMLGMRRTVFVVPADLGGSCRPRARMMSPSGSAGSWRRTSGGQGRRRRPGRVAAGPRRGRAAALRARGGGASGAQLSQDEPRLRTQLSFSLDKSYGGTAYITSRVLVLLAAEGHMVRGHRRGAGPPGSSRGSLPRPGCARRKATGRAGPGAARAELARRWLRTLGRRVSDLRWWGGWTGGQTKAALAALPVAEVDLDGQPGVALADDLEFPAACPPWRRCCRRSTRRRWAGRNGTGSSARTGPRCSTGPATSARPSGGQAAWWRLGAAGVGGGGLQASRGRRGGCRGGRRREAERLETWLGANRATPRFRTPLERELSA